MVAENASAMADVTAAVGVEDATVDVTVIAIADATETATNLPAGRDRTAMNVPETSDPARKSAVERRLVGIVGRNGIPRQTPSGQRQRNHRRMRQVEHHRVVHLWVAHCRVAQPTRQQPGNLPGTRTQVRAKAVARIGAAVRGTKPVAPRPGTIRVRKAGSRMAMIRVPARRMTDMLRMWRPGTSIPTLRHMSTKGTASRTVVHQRPNRCRSPVTRAVCTS